MVGACSHWALRLRGDVERSGGELGDLALTRVLIPVLEVRGAGRRAALPCRRRTEVEALATEGAIEEALPALEDERLGLPALEMDERLCRRGGRDGERHRVADDGSFYAALVRRRHEDEVDGRR